MKDLPEFDVEEAHQIYQSTLGPLRDVWKDSKRLFVVADGPLGTLPFAVLTTKPSPLGNDKIQLFDRYRDTHFLARSHQIANLPSASSLVVLRKNRLASTATKQFIGFGDPVFDLRKADLRIAEAATDSGVRGGTQVTGLRAAPTTRALGDATLAMLPRLPDTSLELLSIAKAVGDEGNRHIYLGVDASESTVDQLNKSGELKDYRTISFATRGLIPGDLNGLIEPALALSEPNAAQKQAGRDGLLTPGEIMLLNLDADWAILSACNTAVGDGAGAEAVSGLGQAFLHAGARSVLVSNWPVHSAATSALMSELFGNYTKVEDMARARALQLAILDLIDRQGWKNDEGQTVFSYAHPIFWAPFVIVGDGA
jgi:CHAT domain-containing protein